MRPMLLLLLCHIGSLGFSQMTGKITLEHVGVEFTIPDGWIGQLTDAGIVLGSQTEAGAVMLTQHESNSLESLRQEAMKGIQEGPGINLMIEGAPHEVGPDAIGATYTGTMQGYPVKAYALGVINPHGKGVSIFSITTPEVYSARQEQLAKDIQKSLRFFKAAISAATTEWKKALANARLTYTESYSSEGSGYSDKVVIDLCASGNFTHSSRYRLSVDTGGAFGNDKSSSGGSGVWQVIQDASGNAVLELKFSNGETREYALQYVNEKTLLDGTRYFRTYDANCP